MQFSEKSKKRVNINVTSLIDVMFILLIFFMVTSSFIEQPGMKLELPATKSRQIARVERMVVYINQEGQMFLNDKPVEPGNLAEEIKALLPYSEQKTLILKADKQAEHGLVVEVMDIAKQNGLEKLVIGTKVKTE
ncbi:biopolymer transporter ExbD [candidate division KSB1 bacterium]|nr:biopolymer transporter ExbD [candidate division KSB1 bacterium]